MRNDKRRWATRRAVLDAALIFALTAVLIWPLFQLSWHDNWPSIESTFIADARFLSENWPNPRWQPLWYGGTRFDYIYPPALRYGTAALIKAGLEPPHAYHVYAAIFYCLGIAGVYVLIFAGTRSRGAAWLGAAATALVSPAFLFLPQFRFDAGFLEPQRLHVLMRYGEGPHMTAVALLPLALAAAFYGLRGRRPALLGVAALLSALVVSNNFYGGTALAVFFPILVWSVWVTHRDRRVWLRALAIALLAYGLTAFWLAPSYVRVTLDNLKIVAVPGNTWSAVLAAALAIVLALLTWRLARGRRELAYPVFVWCSLVAFTVNVIGHLWFGFRVTGEPARLVPEFDLAFILAGVEAARRLWNAEAPAVRGLPRYAPRIAVVLLLVFALAPARKYVANAWRLFPPDPHYQERVEYRLTNWMAQNLPEARTFVTGSIRFWYNAWHSLAQVGGGSEQGLLNPNVMPAQWEVILGPEPEPGILWLTALGADAVIVPDKTSKEVYHDFQHPYKFAGVLPVLHDDNEGNVIYAVPRRFPGLARVVDRAQADSLGPVRFNADVERLRAYVDVAEKGPDAPVAARWAGTDAMRLKATVGDGESILVKATYDPAWRAYSGGTRLPVRRDVLGQMLIDAPAGEHEIRLVFELPLENLAGGIVTGLSVAVLLGLFGAGVRGQRRERSLGAAAG